MCKTLDLYRLATHCYIAGSCFGTAKGTLGGPNGPQQPCLLGLTLAEYFTNYNCSWPTRHL